MHPVSLQRILARHDTWRGLDTDTPRASGTSTGFDSLNRLLGGGWPLTGLVEWLCPLPCPPLMHLLLPLLAAGRPGACLIANPPAQPSASALAAAGVPLGELLVMRSHDRGALLRACLEAAISDTLSVLALWSPGGAWPVSTLRRLHLGARQGRCLLILTRPLRAARQPSPAPLRLYLTCPAPGELDVTVHKQPGRRSGDHCRLMLLPEHLRRPPPACNTTDVGSRLPEPPRRVAVTPWPLTASLSPAATRRPSP